MLILPLPAMAVSETASAELPAHGNYAERDDVQAFARSMAKNDGFSEQGILVVMRQAKYKQSIIDAISRPAEKVLNWSEYQDIFLTERRVREGKKFMVDNEQALAAAYQKYGVPPVIVTAIIGVETMYGSNIGSFRVLDALTTLAFDYPPRSEFFKKQLRQFILLVRDENQSITEVKGSYAGAMGYGQFIPSSYREYAVDFDGDGVRDIWANRKDAIGSVANYFARHGWRKGSDVVVSAKGQAADDVFNVSLKPTSTIGKMRSLGITTATELAESEPVSPMKLVGKQGDEYWLGLHNFYVITRYNHSKLYAMAVFQLSESLRTSATIASRSDH